jgi:hypothetical protein
MKNFWILFLLISFSASSQVKFDNYFLPKTLRFDYTRAGDADTSQIFFEELKQEQFWEVQRLI